MSGSSLYTQGACPLCAMIWSWVPFVIIFFGFISQGCTCGPICSFGMCVCVYTNGSFGSCVMCVWIYIAYLSICMWVYTHTYTHIHIPSYGLCGVDSQVLKSIKQTVFSLELLSCIGTCKTLYRRDGRRVEILLSFFYYYYYYFGCHTK
jgi:hypothetical protein